MIEFPKIISLFPLENFIIFPNTTVPLNIFEPRYIKMVNDSIKSDKFIGIIQPKSLIKNLDNIPSLHKVGCLGKITSFQETGDGRYLIDIKGIIRFEIIKEITSNLPYRKFEVSYNKYLLDLDKQKENLKYSDLELIFKNLKKLFKKKGFIINWEALEKQKLDEIINALAMASPFSLEEKQILLEAINLDYRKSKISEILSTYTFDNYKNNTLQ
jgi:Lon protease-like protein